MSLREALETTKIHSVAGRVKNNQGLMNERPFRSPHHTIWGMLPICNIQLIAQKPCYLDLPDENDTSLGAKLKRRRLALEWTQAETAQLLGIRKDSYQNWEWNLYMPHIKNRKDVNHFLGFNYWDDGSDSISNQVLCYRIEHRLTQDELSQILNVSTATIERIEKTPEIISDDFKNKIEEYLVT